MFCGECGNKIKDGNRFCISCGADISRHLPASEKSSSINPQANSPNKKQNLPNTYEPMMSRAQNRKNTSAKGTTSGFSLWKLIVPAAIVLVVWLNLDRKPELISPDLIAMTHEVKFSNYSVYGATTETIFASIDKNAPECEDIDELTFDCFVYELSHEYEYEEKGNGKCRLTDLDVHLEMEIISPKLNNYDGIDNTLKTKWDKYVKSYAGKNQTTIKVMRDEFKQLPSVFALVYDQYDKCSDLDNAITNGLDQWFVDADEVLASFYTENRKACEKKLQPYFDTVDKYGNETDVMELRLTELEARLEELLEAGDTRYWEVAEQYDTVFELYEETWQKYEKSWELAMWTPC